VQLNEGYEHDVRSVFADGAGCVTVCVSTERALPNFMAAAAAGVGFAATVVRVTREVLRKISCRSQDKALCCWLCDAPTLCRSEPPGAIVVMLPFGVDEPPVVAGLCLCRECCEPRDEAELGQAAVVRLREQWAPDLRVLPPLVAEAGHA
jgi:hypothetical protein